MTIAPSVTDATLRPNSARYPEIGVGPVPAEPYISQEYFELEREKIFKHAWLRVATAHEIPNPGDFFVKNIAVLNASILIVRGKDGVIRAFHNSCRHRGNQLGRCNPGEICKQNKKAFVCNFHGWTYSTEGELVFVSDEEQFVGVDKKTRGLKPLSCDVWQGNVFINMDLKPRQPLREFLGGMADQLEGFPFEELTLLGYWAIDAKVNWKLCIDAFQEPYHVATVHKLSLMKTFNDPDNDPYCHMREMRLHGPHRSYSVPLNPHHQPLPSEGAAMKVVYTVKKGEDAPKPTLGTNPFKIENWGFEVNTFFPNFMYDTANEMVFLQLMWPLAADKTYYETILYGRHPKTAAEMVAMEHTRAMYRFVVREDFRTMEAMQAGLMTGQMEELMFGDQEVTCRHQYKVVDEMVNS